MHCLACPCNMSADGQAAAHFLIISIMITALSSEFSLQSDSSACVMCGTAGAHHCNHGRVCAYEKVISGMLLLYDHFSHKLNFIACLFMHNEFIELKKFNVNSVHTHNIPVCLPYKITSVSLRIGNWIYEIYNMDTLARTCCSFVCVCVICVFKS